MVRPPQTNMINRIRPEKVMMKGRSLERRVARNGVSSFATGKIDWAGFNEAKGMAAIEVMG